MKRLLIGLGLLVVIAGGSYWLYKQALYTKEPVPEQTSIRDVVRSTDVETQTMDDLEVEATAEAEEAPVPVNIPAELNLEVPFYTQAPHGNWDYPWQEACEEASVLLVANVYYDHDWNVDEFNEEILAMVDWQMEEFGDYIHTDMEQTAQILEEYLGLDTVLHYDPTFEDVQEVLARGHLIVMPFAGRELGNPFFTAPGPIYHVVVVKGYKEGEKLITHDVGTRRGADYVYTWDVAQPALHDYAEPIDAGEAVFIEVLPPDLNE